MVVCSDRIRGAQTAVDKLGAQVLVMDDGFGHRRLARSMDLLLFTERLLHINTHLLPAGYFREPLAAAQRARAIVVDWSNGAESREPLLRWAQGKPVLSLRKSAAGVLPLDRWLSDPNEQNSALLPAETLKGKRVLAFCGIAHPESFRDLLAGYDPGLLELVAFQDHCAYGAQRQKSLWRRAKDSGAILVTTEKDATKLDPGIIGAECMVVILRLEEHPTGALQRLVDELLHSGA